MSQRFKLTLEYDGGGFSGWQKQLNHPSVQEALEIALEKVTGAACSAYAAGRTDAGVHALGQVAHVDIDKPLDGYTLMKALNAWLLKVPLVVIKAEPMPETFHARFSCRARHYRYRIRNTRSMLALEKDRAWLVHRELDVAAMQVAAERLVGHHDFSTFRAITCQASSPLRTLSTATVEVTSLPHAGREIVLDFSAKSFLHHQVRNMVGSLVSVGWGRWSVEEFQQRFDAKDRTQGGQTAPPEGLYFMGADYLDL